MTAHLNSFKMIQMVTDDYVHTRFDSLPDTTHPPITARLAR